MKVDFFQAQCQSETAAPRFGIHDQEPAKLVFGDLSQCEAKVQNPNHVLVTFTAIDKCIDIRNPVGSEGSSCDGMLTYPNGIVFVELKDKMKDWINDAKGQVAVTIAHFKQSHDIVQFRKKRAFLCNRAHPSFKYGLMSTMNEFHHQHSVRLIISAEITIP